MKKILFILSVLLFVSCDKDDLSSKLQAPVALEATHIAKHYFRAHWISSYGASAYEVDVATDIDFVNIISSKKYDDEGIVDKCYINIYELQSGTEYFYRVRAATFWWGGPISKNSNIIQLVTQPD